MPIDLVAFGKKYAPSNDYEGADTSWERPRTFLEDFGAKYAPDTPVAIPEPPSSDAGWKRPDAAPRTASLGTKAYQFYDNLVSGAAQGALDLGSLTNRVVGNGERADTLLNAADIVDADQTARDQEAGLGKTAQTVNAWTRGAARSLTEMAPAAAAAPFGGGIPIAIGLGMANQANQSYKAGKEAGLEGAGLAAYTTAMGLAEGVFERMSGVGLENVFGKSAKQAVTRGFVNGIKEIAKDLGIETAQELATTATQNLIDESAGMIDKTLAENPGAMTKPEYWAKTLIDTVGQTVMMGGLTGPHRVVKAKLADYNIWTDDRLQKEAGRRNLLDNPVESSRDEVIGALQRHDSAMAEAVASAEKKWPSSTSGEFDAKTLPNYTPPPQAATEDQPSWMRPAEEGTNGTDRTDVGGDGPLEPPSIAPESGARPKTLLDDFERELNGPKPSAVPEKDQPAALWLRPDAATDLLATPQESTPLSSALDTARAWSRQGMSATPEEEPTEEPAQPFPDYLGAPLPEGAPMDLLSPQNDAPTAVTPTTPMQPIPYTPQSGVTASDMPHPPESVAPAPVVATPPPIPEVSAGATAENRGQLSVVSGQEGAGFTTEPQRARSEKPDWATAEERPLTLEEWKDQTQTTERPGEVIYPNGHKEVVSGDHDQTVERAYAQAQQDALLPMVSNNYAYPDGMMTFEEWRKQTRAQRHESGIVKLTYPDGTSKITGDRPTILQRNILHSYNDARDSGRLPGAVKQGEPTGTEQTPLRTELERLDQRGAITGAGLPVQNAELPVQNAEQTGQVPGRSASVEPRDIVSQNAPRNGQTGQVEGQTVVPAGMRFERLESARYNAAGNRIPETRSRLVDSEGQPKTDWHFSEQGAIDQWTERERVNAEREAGNQVYQAALERVRSGQGTRADEQALVRHYGGAEDGQIHRDAAVAVLQDVHSDMPVEEARRMVADMTWRPNGPPLTTVPLGRLLDQARVSKAGRGQEGFTTEVQSTRSETKPETDWGAKSLAELRTEIESRGGRWHPATSKPQAAEALRTWDEPTGFERPNEGPNALTWTAQKGSIPGHVRMTPEQTSPKQRPSIYAVDVRPGKDGPQAQLMTRANAMSAFKPASMPFEGTPAAVMADAEKRMATMARYQRKGGAAREKDSAQVTTETQSTQSDAVQLRVQELDGKIPVLQREAQERERMAAKLADEALAKPKMVPFAKQARKNADRARLDFDLARQQLSALTEQGMQPQGTQRTQGESVPVGKPVASEVTQNPEGLKAGVVETQPQTAPEQAVTTEAQKTQSGPAMRMGPEFSARTPQENTEVRGTWGVMELDDVVSSERAEYDRALQPRDRTTNDASDAQIAQMAANLHPDQLGNSPLTDTGAPIVNALGHVVSGNGRTMALRKAATARNPKKSQEYQSWVQQEAGRLGIDVSGMKFPVLVRQMDDTASEKPAPYIAELSNRSHTLERTPAEQAISDAKMMPDIIHLYDPSEKGDLMAASNHSFLSAFVQRTGAKHLFNRVFSPDIVPRVQRAMLAMVFGNTERAHRLMALSVDDQARLGAVNTITGIMREAGNLAKIQSNKPTLDILPHLGEALEVFLSYKEQAKRRFVSLDGYLRQQDLGRDALSEEAMLLLREMADRQAPGRFRTFLARYVELAEQQDTTTMSLFGDEMPDATPLELLERVRDEHGQRRQEGSATAETGDIFGESEGRPPESAIGEQKPARGAARAGESGHEGEVRTSPAENAPAIDKTASDGGQLREEDVSHGRLREPDVQSGQTPIEALRGQIAKDRKRGETFGDTDIREVRQPFSLRARLTKRIADLFGVEAVWFEQSANSRIPFLNGVYFKGRVYLNAREKNPAGFVVSHEVIHHFRDTHPAEYARLKKVIGGLLDQSRYAKYKQAAAKQRGELGGVDEDVLAEEFLADLSGTFGRDVEFWREVAAQDRSALDKLVDAIAEVLERVQSALKKHPSQSVSDPKMAVLARDAVRDLEKARDAIAKALGRSLGEERARSEGDGGGTKMRFSLRTNEDGSMVAMHNLSAGNLRLVDELGGFSMPSIAIHDVGQPFDSYGDITLVGDPGLIDPGRSKTTKVYDADAYSPRYPTMQYTVNKSQFIEAIRPIFEAAQQRLSPQMLKEMTRAETAEDYWYRVADNLKNRGLSGLTQDPLIQWWYRGMPENEEVFVKSEDWSKLDRAIAEKFGHLFKERKFWVGTTPMGNNRYKPYTLDNVFAAMRKELLTGGEGAFFGPGQLRAVVAKRFRNLTAIQKERHRLATREEMDKAKDAINEEAVALSSDALAGRDFSNPFIAIDGFWDYIKDGLRSPKVMREAIEFYKLDESFLIRLNEFLQKLKSMPTEYFEAKLKRIVGLNEFSGAVIPANAPQEVREILEKHGIRHIEEYKPSDAQDRQQATQRLADTIGARFSQSQRPARGVDSGVVERRVKRMGLLWRGMPQVHVVQSERELPSNIRQAGMRGAYDPASDTVWLVADNLDDQWDATMVLFHEVVGHWGIEAILGKGGDDFYTQMALARFNEIKDFAQKKGWAFNSTEDRRTAREWLAERVESGELGSARTWWERLKQLVRDAIHRIAGVKSGDPSPFSDEALESLVRAAIGVTRGGESLTTETQRTRSLEGARYAAAWHGTPHTWEDDKADMSKVGSGEGNQSYGHGLYFAGKREVAEWYRDQLSGRQKPSDSFRYEFGGKTFTLDEATSLLSKEILKELGIELSPYGRRQLHGMERGQHVSRVAQALEGKGEEFFLRQFNTHNNVDLGELINSYSYRVLYDWGVSPDSLPELYGSSAAARALSQFSAKESYTKGRLYQVELAPKEEDYLYWDKPMREQNDKVKEAYSEWFGLDEFSEQERAKFNYKILRQTGIDFYNDLAATERGKRGASAWLAERGIPGIKYLDHSSRGKDEGSYNYVIFDDKDVTVTARYSLAETPEHKREYAKIEAELKAHPERYRDADGNLVADNGKKSNLNAHQWIQVRTTAFKRWFGDWQHSVKRKMLEDMKPIPIDTEAFGKPEHRGAVILKALGQIAQWRKDGKTFTNRHDGRVIGFSRKGEKKIGSHTADLKTGQVIAGLPEILRNAVPLYSEGTNRPDAESAELLVRFHHYGAKVALGGENTFVRLVVREDNNGNFHYDHIVSENPKDASQHPHQVSSPGDAGKRPSPLILSDWWHSVNPAEVSKVVDENGEPKVVYHGTERTFSVFDNKSATENTDEFGPGGDIRYSLAEAKTDEERRGVLEAARDAAQDAGIALYMTARGKMGDINAKPDISRIHKFLGTMQYYSKKVPALHKLWQAGQNLGNYKHVMEKMVFVNADGVDEFKLLTNYARKNKAEWARLMKYMWGNDLDARGYGVRERAGEWVVFSPDGESLKSFGANKENEAWAYAYSLGAQAVRNAGFSEDAAQAWLLVRTILHREYAQLRASTEELRALFKDLSIEPTKVPGTDISIFDALRQMGDRRGYYLPRIRKPGRYQAWITDANGHQDMQQFDTTAARYMYAVKKAHKMGMLGSLVSSTKGVVSTSKGRIEFRLNENPSEGAYLDADVAAMNDLLQKAVEQLQKEQKAQKDPGNMKAVLAEMGLEFARIRYPRTDGHIETHLVIRGDKAKEYASILKDFKGQRYVEKPGSETEVWHFVKPSATLEKTLFSALHNQGSQRAVVNAMGEALAKNVAHIIEARGSRSHKIGRSEATGEAVVTGFETDILKAVAMAGKGTAGGSAKGMMAKEMMNAFMGIEKSWRQTLQEALAEDEDVDREALWEEWQAGVNERRIDSGLQPHAFEDGQDFMREMLRNDTGTERIMGKLRGIMAVKYLSSLATGLVNLTSLVTSVPAAMHAAGISAGKIPRLLSQGGKSYLETRTGRGKLEEEDVWLYKRMRELGLDDALYYEEAAKTLLTWGSRLTGGVTEKMMLVMSQTERMNRGTTLFAAYYGIKEEHPELSRNELVERAVTVMNEAHAVYGKTGLPSWARGAGFGKQMVRGLYMFQNYPHNYLQLLYQMGVPKATRDWTAAAWLLVAPALLAGPEASPASAPLEWIVKRIFNLLGIPPPDDVWEALYEWLGDTFGFAAEHAGRSGLVGLATGATIKGSLQFNAPRAVTSLVDSTWAAASGDWRQSENLPVTAWDLAGPTGSGLLEMIHAGKAAYKGHPLQAAELIAPRLIAAPIKAGREYFEGVSTQAGDPVYYGNERLRATLYDALMRSGGFNPANIGEKREEQFKEKSAAKHYAAARDAIYDEYKDLLRRGNMTGEEREQLLTVIRAYNDEVAYWDPKGMYTRITDSALKGIETKTGRPNRYEQRRAAAMENE